MYLGIDLGTSAIKAVLVDDNAQVIAEFSQALAISRPKPNWSEQNAHDYWDATCAAMDHFARDHGPSFDDRNLPVRQGLAPGPVNARADCRPSL